MTHDDAVLGGVPSIRQYVSNWQCQEMSRVKATTIFTFLIFGPVVRLKFLRQCAQALQVLQLEPTEPRTLV